MSREEAMKALIESGMELRRDDIELGKQLERERILNMLTEQVNRLEEMRPAGYKSVAQLADIRISTIRKVIQLIKGEQK